MPTEERRAGTLARDDDGDMLVWALNWEAGHYEWYAVDYGDWLAPAEVVLERIIYIPEYRA